MDHRHLTLHEGYLYFAGSGQSCSFGSEGSSCTGGGIHRIALDGGEPEQVLDAVAVSNVVSNARGVYWFASSPPRVMFAERGGAEREVANVLNEGIGINGIATLRADADALYWSADDTVLRLPFDSEQVTRLVTELDGASDVAVRGDWVYVAESVGGRILRVATDGSANAPLGPITGPCPTPLGSPAELALTPRPDPDLELLALSLDPGNLTANQATYERVVADVTAIRALEPELADIGYFGAQSARSLTLLFTHQGAQSLAAGQYSAWDCLNDAYGVTSIVPYEIFGDTLVSLELEGIYDTVQLGQLYAQLPEVSEAGADGILGEGPTLCAARDGERYEYVVDNAGGDCPSGCTEHEAHHFETDSAGQATKLGVWNSESGDAAPEWFGRLCR